MSEGFHDEATEDALRLALEQAKAAWPTLRISDADFVAYLAARAETREALAAAHVSDLYLACACARGDERALELFESILSEVGVAFARVRAPIGLDEAKQQVRMKLLVADGDAPRITLYRGEGELRAWVRVVATRHLLNVATRAPKETREAGDSIGELADGRDPEIALLKRRHGEALKRAFDRAAGELSDRERALLRQALVERRSIDEIGALHSIHRATAARWVAAARSVLQKNVRRALREELRLTETEVESMLRVIESEIELSVSRILGPAAPSRGETA